MTRPEPVLNKEPKPAFEVELENYSGPFDVLLSLVARRRLDITEVALAEVTDEFLEFMRTHEDLSQATEFLVVAATLLDIKAARLLPDMRESTDEDIQFLEARDLLFARLLQYRAFKVIAGELGEKISANSGGFPRKVHLEPQFAMLLPQLVGSIDGTGLGALAHSIFTHEPVQVITHHLHDPLVSLSSQVSPLVEQLRAHTNLSFEKLCANADHLQVVVSRFLVLLELYRQRLVCFEQPQALGSLMVKWIGPKTGQVQLGEVFNSEVTVG